MNESVTDQYAATERKFQGATSRPFGLPSWLVLLGVGFATGELARGVIPELMLGAGVLGLVGAGVMYRQRRSTVVQKRRSLFGVVGFIVIVSLALGIGAFRMLGVAMAPEGAVAEASATAVAERDRLLQAAVANGLQVGRNALTRVTSAPRGTQHSFSDLLSGAALETGLVVLSGDSVVAVAGSSRAGIDPSGSAGSILGTPFHRLLTLTERRDGIRVQISILLDALPSLPDPGRSLSGAAGAFQRVGWTWRRGGGWEHFESIEEAVAAVAARMTVVPPEIGALVSREDAVARWLLVATLLVGAIVVLSVSSEPAARAMAVLAAPWVMTRAGIVPPPFGASGSAMAMVAFALMMVAVLLWRHPRRRAPIGWVAAGLLLAGTPFMVAVGAQAISGHVGAMTTGAWLAWQAALAVATAAFLAVASAPLLSDADRGRGPGWGVITILVAVAAGAVGTAAWLPSGWPQWLVVTWWLAMAAMIPATSPLARRVAIAVVAGVMAASAAWGAMLDRRVAAARQDLVELGNPDNLAIANQMKVLGSRIRDGGSAAIADVYGTWLRSDLAGGRVPVSLSVWTERRADPVAWLTLDRLAPTWEDVEGVVRDRSLSGEPVAIRRGEALHQLLAIDMAGDTTVAVLVGPQSRLMEPTRLGRLIGWRTESNPPYRLARRPDRSGMTPDTIPFIRSGRFVRTEQLLTAGEWPMVVGATVEIAGQRQFAVRSSLTVLGNIALVLLIWIAVEGLLGTGSATTPGVLRRSYRRRVAAALIGFFLVPAVGFTMWTMLRLRQDVQRERIDAVDEALREVADEAGLVAATETGRAASDRLAVLADRVQAEIAVYEQGRAIVGSEGVLMALGVLPPVLDPALVAEVGEGVPTSRPVSGAWLGASRSGPGPVVAVALPSGTAALEREETDLALLLLLTSIAAIVAAAGVAGMVARGLGQPIDELRRMALAIGRRQRADDLHHPPVEFEPVFAAIRQMETDLAESDARLEEETARSARVVAWGEMARQVAHEIKNPLTPMRLGLQHLRRLGVDGAPDLAGRTSATADRLLAEIDRLDRIARAFARYGAPPEREDGPLEEIDLGEVAAELVELYRLAGAVPRVTVEGEGEKIVVSARAEELRQVILNLIDNSRQAGAENVKVLIGHRSLTVTDDGEGVPADQIDRLFEPTFSTTSSGTGLGLAIVRRLVEGWGATISVSSRHGEGASFTLSFPATGTIGSA